MSGLRTEVERALADLAQPADPPPMGGALETALADLQPVGTRRPLRQLFGALAAAAVYAAAITGILALRPDSGELPLSWVVLYGAAWFLGFAAPLTLALVPPRGRVLARARVAGLAGLATAAALGALGLVSAQAGPSSVLAAPGLAGFVSRAWPCLLLGNLVAIAPTVVGVWLLRRASPVHGAWTAAALGAAGGAIGGLVLHLHCPIANASHVGGVHAGVVMVAALITAVAAHRALE